MAAIGISRLYHINNVQTWHVPVVHHFPHSTSLFTTSDC